MKAPEISKEKTTQLQAAVASYEAAVNTKKERQKAIASLKAKMSELESEIYKTGEQISQLLTTQSVDVAELKFGAEKQFQLQAEMNALSNARDAVIKRYNIENDNIYADDLGIQDTRYHCYGIIYNELLKALDTELLNHVFCFGMFTGNPLERIAADLCPNKDYESAMKYAASLGLPTT